MRVRLRPLPDRSPRSVVRAKATSESQHQRPRAATFQVSTSARFAVPPCFRASVALFLHARVVTSPGHIQMFACGNKCARRRGRNRDDRRQGTCFTRPFITLSIKEYRRVAIPVSVPASKEPWKESSTNSKCPMTYCERANMDPSPSGHQLIQDERARATRIPRKKAGETSKR